MKELNSFTFLQLGFYCSSLSQPEEYQARGKNKFTYRYPRGESYQDIVSRLEPVLVELMRQKDPILIVSHQATLRVLVSYLRDMGAFEWLKKTLPVPYFISLPSSLCRASFVS